MTERLIQYLRKSFQVSWCLEPGDRSGSPRLVSFGRWATEMSELVQHGLWMLMAHVYLWIFVPMSLLQYPYDIEQRYMQDMQMPRLQTSANHRSIPWHSFASGVPLICVSKCQRKESESTKMTSPWWDLDHQLCKVRHMVEHSLHLLLRERSKEFGKPSASRSFGWSDTDSLVQFDTNLT